MRFQFIAAEKAHHSLPVLCRCLRVTRSGFYAWQDRPASPRTCRDHALKQLVQRSFTASRQRYGSPRIHADLQALRERVGRKRIVRLMREAGLRARVTRRWAGTTPRDHGGPVAGNVLARQFTADRPNQRWVADTTEVVIGDSGKLYLAVLIDLYSRVVVGWAVSPVNDRHLTRAALERALTRRRPRPGLLHHSDQGSPYACADYQRVLATHGLTCSMSRRGDCFDNAVAESFFATLKGELAARFATIDEATRQFFDYIDVFYNQRRRHSTLGQISPAEFERRAVQAA